MSLRLDALALPTFGRKSVIRELAASIERQHKTADEQDVSERMSGHEERGGELPRETQGRWRYASAVQAALALNGS
jgi:hypothetical protein